GEREPPAKVMRRGLRRGREEEREQLPCPGESASGMGAEAEPERTAPLSDERRRRQPLEPRALSTTSARAVEEEERLEREHFRRIINAFRYYGHMIMFRVTYEEYEEYAVKRRTNMHERVNRTERQFKSLPANQQNLLPQFLPHLDKIRKCIDHNQEILQTIVNDCVHMFENKEYGEDGGGKITPASTFDMDKLKSTLKQFVRDWSEEGKSERDSCYQPIINEIIKNFPKERWDFSKVNILVPGAGLDALKLIHVSFIRGFINLAITEDLLIRYDQFISQIYHSEIHRTGPLLYHFENLGNELSIELSYEDIKNVILQYGFHIEVEKESVLSTYTVNELSMMKYYYECVLFVVRKPE
ncbi:hypothetical protein IHE44_0011136, partial [Lamprotornis superbus]